jgi:hypothetical protein
MTRVQVRLIPTQQAQGGGDGVFFDERLEDSCGIRRQSRGVYSGATPTPNIDRRPR